MEPSINEIEKALKYISKEGYYYAGKHAKEELRRIATRLKALKQQNSREYITLQWIETWDGKLPNVVANDKVMPILDMK